MNKQNLSIAEIRSSLSKEKRVSDADDPWLHFVVRPISYHPTWLFLKLGISANQTTFIGLIIGIIGCVFLAFGSYWAAIIGAILVNIRFLFDVVDGNIARCTNSCTKYGTYFDRMTTYIIAPLTFITVGIGVFNHPDPYLNSLALFFFGVDISKNIYLILGLSVAILSIWGALVTSSLGAVFFIKSADYYKPKAGPKRSLYGIMHTLGLGLVSIMRPMLMLAAIARFLGVFLFLWVLIEISYFIIVAVQALIMAKRIGGTPG